MNISRFLQKILVLLVVGGIGLLVQAADYSGTAPRGEVVVIHDFELPQLYTTRNLRIYLPVGYQSGDQRYPVAYFMDGQNVFTSEYAAKGGWQINKTLDALIASGEMPPIIVVAIDNSTNRSSEYVPFSFSNSFASSSQSVADDMLDFVVNTVKPYIDSSYRTQPEPEHSMLAGSSFGGFFTLYAAVNYPNTFGMWAPFSTALASAPARSQMLALLDESEFPKDSRWFLYVGQGESTYDSQAVYRTLKEKGLEHVVHVIDPQGAHDEPSWAAAMRTALPWLFKQTQETAADWTGLTRESGFYDDYANFTPYVEPEAGAELSAGLITFTYDAAEAQQVAIAGDLNGWNPASVGYQFKKNKDGLFELTLDLDAGRYEYKLVVDGQWVEAAPTVDRMTPKPTSVIPNGFGGSNAVLVLND